MAGSGRFQALAAWWTGTVLLAYAAVTTVAMALLARRAWAPLLVHGGTAALCAGVWLATRTPDPEAVRRSLRVERVAVGSRGRGAVTLANDGGFPLTIGRVVARGAGGGDAMRRPRGAPDVRLEPGARVDVALERDGDEAPPPDWTWTVECTVLAPQVLSLRTCAPGEQGDCLAMPAPSVAPGAPRTR